MKIPIRVLIIEDSEDDKELMLHELRRGNYEPDSLCVETNEALNSALDKQRWDFILSDYSLPDFDGLLALQIVKERGLDIPFIIVSGAIGEDVAVTAMRSGAHDYIMKDNLKRLVPAIERELKEAGIRRKQKKDEEDLLHSELKFRLLAEFTHDWEYWIDPAGKYIYTSPACKRITGYSSEELITNQTLFMDLVHPGFKEKIGDHFTNEISDSRSLAKIEFPIINRNGETIWLEHTCSPIFDEQNKHLGRRGSNRDITQRIQSEERLRINESRLIEAQRIGKLGSLDWNLITNEIEISAETIRIYGLDPANNKPQVEEIVKCVHPDDLERVNQSLKAAVTEEAQHEG